MTSTNIGPETGVQPAAARLSPGQNRLAVAILAALVGKFRPVSARELASELRRDRNVVASVAATLARSGRIVREGRGYVLVPMACNAMTIEGERCLRTAGPSGRCDIHLDTATEQPEGPKPLVDGSREENIRLARRILLTGLPGVPDGRGKWQAWRVFIAWIFGVGMDAKATGMGAGFKRTEPGRALERWQKAMAFQFLVAYDEPFRTFLRTIGLFKRYEKVIYATPKPMPSIHDISSTEFFDFLQPLFGEPEPQGPVRVVPPRPKPESPDDLITFETDEGETLTLPRWQVEKDYEDVEEAQEEAEASEDE